MKNVDTDTLAAELEAFPYLITALGGNYNHEERSTLTDQTMQEVTFALSRYAERIAEDVMIKLEQLEE